MNVNIKWNGEQNFTGENKKGESVVIDPSPKKDGVISPPDLLLMSLGSCTGLFLIPSSKELNVDLENFDINLEGVKAKEPPKLFDKIILNVKLKGNLTEEEGYKVLERAHDKCFILKSLNPNIEIENNIELI
jgi:putative redox protein